MNNYNSKNIFICPISRELFKEPVLADDGFFYEKNEIEKWLKAKNTSPLTGLYMNKTLMECHFFSTLLKVFYKENPHELLDRYDNSKIHVEYIDEVNELLECEKYEKLLQYSHFDLALIAKKILVQFLQTATLDIFKYFIDSITNMEEICDTKLGQKLIHVVSKNCDEEKIKYLIDKKIDLEAYTLKNWKPIHYVIKFSTPEIIKYLIDKDVDLECANQDGWRPIHYAINFSTLEIIKYLIDKKINLECQDCDNWRPIHYACCAHSPEIIKYVISLGVSLECKTITGKLPIHYICKYSTPEIIKYAIELGLDLECVTNKGNSSLDYLQKRIKHNNRFLKNLICAGN